MDVTNVNEVKEVEKEVLNRFGKIDILINNAGYGLFGALEDLKDEEIRYQMEVNFFGTVNVTKMTNDEKARIYEDCLRESDALQRQNSKIKSEFAGIFGLDLAP
jgi:NAD(P)-dependent dehydrogenase (short-subunit alcohol dehydrogenase family)